MGFLSELSVGLTQEFQIYKHQKFKAGILLGFIILKLGYSDGMKCKSNLSIAYLTFQMMKQPTLYQLSTFLIRVSLRFCILQALWS